MKAQVVFAGVSFAGVLSSSPGALAQQVWRDPYQLPPAAYAGPKNAPSDSGSPVCIAFDRVPSSSTTPGIDLLCRQRNRILGSGSPHRF
jgi:hypothetical protein